jgi:hypothetical protein
MIRQEYLTFFILSKSEEQLLWCIKNIRYKNSSKILVQHEKHSEVVVEICARYDCQTVSDLEDAREKFKLNPTRYLIIINDTTRISQIDFIPEHAIIGGIEAGCLILARDKIDELDLSLKGENWHWIKDVSGREWWHYPKIDYPILSPCMLEDAKCKSSHT